jgi:hypothetical protein
VLRRKPAVLVTAAMMLASMLAISSPASAQGGCKEFGHHVVSDVQASPPAGQFIRTLAPLNDDALGEQAQFCG